MWRLDDNKCHMSSCKIQTYPENNGELIKGIFF